MVKKLLFLVVAILVGGMTAVQAKINYVPLYIVDTQPDVKVVKRAPSMPLIITQDNYKLILPEIDDDLTFMVLKDNDCVYKETRQQNQSTVNLPTTLTGDYEVRLCANTYYYYGYITLDRLNISDVPNENANWENITLLGSNTSQQAILDDIMGLNVVKYNMKFKSSVNETYLSYLSKEERDSYEKAMEKKAAELRAQERFGLLPEELSAIFPQLVVYYENGEFGINYGDLIPIMISCIQELKIQLDSRTEKIVDVMMSRGTGPSAVSAARAIIGNTLLSAAPTSVSEPALVRFVLTDNAANAYITITDMGGRVMTKVPISPSETSVSIDSGILGEGIFLCTLCVNGENIATKRLVKTK